MSLVELIAQADDRALAVGGLACLDRCVPLLGGDDEVLRPLWTSLADGAVGETWGESLEQARAKLPALFEEPGEDQAVRLARTMLAAAPLVPARKRRGTGVGRRLLARLAADPPAAGGHDPVGDADDVEGRREGRTDDMSPLVAAELRRQIAVLELLAATGSGGLRQVLAVSTEGRRVLRAVVSRRARGRS